MLNSEQPSCYTDRQYALLVRVLLLRLMLQILLIRSLYSYVRVLPAYRMYRACKRHGRELFNTSYTISTAPLPLTHQQQYGSTAAAAGAGSSNRRMQQFVFSPIETMYGVFEMSVEYQPATTVQFLEVRLPGFVVIWTLLLSGRLGA